MALEEILKVIADDAAQEVSSIRQTAEEAYGSRMQAARAQAQDVRACILAAAERTAQQEKARQLHQVRLENLRQQVQVQETVFQAAVRRSQEILVSARERPDYPAILARLLTEALANTDEPAAVVVHPNDVALIRAILDANQDRPFRVEIEEGLAPGVMVRSADGKIVTENTLASRLQRSLPDLRPMLVDLLKADPSRQKDNE